MLGFVVEFHVLSIQDNLITDISAEAGGTGGSSQKLPVKENPQKIS